MQAGVPWFQEFDVTSFLVDVDPVSFFLSSGGALRC